MRKYVPYAFSLLAAFALLAVGTAKADTFKIHTPNISSGIHHTGDTLSIKGETDWFTLDLAPGESTEVDLGDVTLIEGSCGRRARGICSGEDDVKFKVTLTDTSLHGPGRTDTENIYLDFTDSVDSHGHDLDMTPGSELYTFTIGGMTLSLTNIELVAPDGVSAFGIMPMCSGGGGGKEKFDLVGLISTPPPVTTPEPMSMVLMGSFLSLAGGLIRRKK